METAGQSPYASTLIAACFCALGAVLGPVPIPLQIPGLDADAVRLSIGLNTIVFWLVLVRALNTILGSVLNSLHNYLVPASGKFVANTVAIVVVALFSHRIGIYALAYGLLAGDVTQVVVKIATAKALGVRFRLTCRIKDAELRTIYRSFTYPFLGHGLGEARVLLENYLVSFLGGGAFRFCDTR